MKMNFAPLTVLSAAAASTLLLQLRWPWEQVVILPLGLKGLSALQNLKADYRLKVAVSGHCKTGFFVKIARRRHPPELR